MFEDFVRKCFEAFFLPLSKESEEKRDAAGKGKEKLVRKMQRISEGRREIDSHKYARNKERIWGGERGRESTRVATK